jgi:hypothetical protein
MIPYVPMLRDPGGVLFIEHRIEDRLLGLAGREPGPARRLDESQFLRPDRALEDCYVAHYSPGSMD